MFLVQPPIHKSNPFLPNKPLYKREKKQLELLCLLNEIVLIRVLIVWVSDQSASNR